MKDGIHPEYIACTITCSCGAVYHTRSTRQQIHIEICANCHPFFTGQQRFVDTAGRVEKFRRKYTKAKG
ncbi:MAG: 50S ribosomal protein L31 [Candidatus Omnitrophica bacterium]|nr:50S ribosomal protein L31 [Candidatus Omnitrophota bacterium]